MATTYDPIATTTLGSAAASITFSSISSAYTDLRLVMTQTNTDNVSPRLRLNSDTGSNYSITILEGQGTAASSYAYTSQTFAYLAQYASDPTSPSLITIDFMSYSGSTNKTFLITTSNDKNGSGSVERVVGLYRSTSALSTVLLYLGGTSNFAIGTTATLYGIKNA